MDLDEAVHNYVKHLADDYGTNGYNNKKFYAVHGRKYLHIVMEDNQRSSHSWVMLVDDKKFKRGDILKSASWNAPARNFKRGNVLTGEFKHIRWCGA
jgi:hypothetical protein